MAFTHNVTDGIAAVASSLDWHAGDSVVLCEELEHPANIYPWYGVSRKFGVKVKNVPQSGGTVPLESILDNMDPSCRGTASYLSGCRSLSTCYGLSSLLAPSALEASIGSAFHQSRPGGRRRRSEARLLT